MIIFGHFLKIASNRLSPRSRPDSGKSGVVSRTSEPREWMEETVKNLNTVKAKTFHWSKSQNCEVQIREAAEEVLPEEIEAYQEALDSDSSSLYTDASSDFTRFFRC